MVVLFFDVGGGAAPLTLRIASAKPVAASKLLRAVATRSGVDAGTLEVRDASGRVVERAAAGDVEVLDPDDAPADFMARAVSFDSSRKRPHG